MKRPRTTHRARWGLTLIELMIAIAVTAMIGAAIGIVMTAAGQNLSRVGEVRSALQRSHAMHARLRAYIDAAYCVLDEDPSQGFAVWLHDDNAGGTINLTELRVIWYDMVAETLTVEWFVFPKGLTEPEQQALDRELSVGTDYFMEMTGLRAIGQTAQIMIADGVASFTLTHDAVSFINAKRLRAAASLRVNDNDEQGMLFTIGISEHTVPN